MSDEIKSNIDSLELYSDNSPFKLSLRIKNFESEADFKRFCKNCEMNIRHSLEYKMWRNYIVDILGVNKCVITNESIDECNIQVHHHVPSLYTIVKTIINKNIELEKPFCTFDISTEIIELHFSNIIGYICILPDLHNKFHNGFLDIPIKLVKGNYKVFLDQYAKYMDDEDLEIIDRRLKVNSCNCSWSKDNYPGIENI